MAEQLTSQRIEPGTLREYETIYILRPDSSSDQILEVNAMIRGLIDEGQGRVIRLDNWGKRKLAYEIKKQLKGIYLYWLYLGHPGLVSEIERRLRMKDLCIRTYTVAVDENVDPEARPSQIDDETFAAAATLVPDEEDAYMGRTYGDDEQPETKSDDAPAGDKPAGDKPAEDKPAEDAPAEAKPAEDAPAEAKPAEDKPAEAKPAEDAPAEAKPAEDKPAEDKPAEDKPAEAAAEEKKEEE